MGIFGGPCKHLVSYDGENWDFAGLTGPDKLNIKIGELKGNRQVLQTAADITQLYDAMQFSNCTRINQLPKDSPDRVKLAYESMQGEQQLVQLALLIKLLQAQPNSDKLQQAIAEWIAAQSKRLSTLPAAPPKVAPLREAKVTVSSVRLSIKKAADSDPHLKQALASKTSFDLSRYLT